MGNRTVKDHVGGGKITGAHTSVIPAASKPVREAEKLNCVLRIRLGFIKGAPGGNGHRISFSEASPKCVLAKVRGPGSVQDIYVYFAEVQDREAVEAAMRAALPAT